MSDRYYKNVKTIKENCDDIQAAVDKGDKCELGETNKERLARKESYGNRRPS